MQCQSDFFQSLKFLIYKWENNTHLKELLQRLNKTVCFKYQAQWLAYPKNATNANCFISDGKESACNVGDPLVGKIPWRRECLCTPVFLPGEFHVQRSQGGSTVCGVAKSWTRLRD